MSRRLTQAATVDVVASVLLAKLMMREHHDLTSHALVIPLDAFSELVDMLDGRGMRLVIDPVARTITADFAFADEAPVVGPGQEAVRVRGGALRASQEAPRASGEGSDLPVD